MAAQNSLSQQVLNNTFKERKAGDPPTRLAHLFDKCARKQRRSLELKFHKASRTIAPAPGNTAASQWPLTNQALVIVDAASAYKTRVGRPKASRNNVASQDLELTIHTAHSGDVGFKQILKQVLLCGDYNDVLDEVNNIRSAGREAEYNYNTSVVCSLGQIESIHSAEKESNKLAGGQRSNEDIEQDNDIGGDVHELPQDPDAFEEFISNIAAV